MPAPDKCLSLYSESEVELWEQVETAVRNDHDAHDAREGEVLGQALACYLGTDGPLDRDTKCPLCGELVNPLSNHIEDTHDSQEINV